jgi:adenine/guanine/hypoxanthine permease
MEQTKAGNPKSLAPLLERVFGLAKAGTNPRTELVAGLTTFLTMVYIVFVNPQILGNTGMDKGAVFVATCIAAAVSTLVMALYANYPIALAPGMGLNAFFAFTVVLTMKYTWQQALAAVFCSGVIFFFISIFRIREYIINAIPRNLKLAISAGVGLFLGIIALEEAKIVVASPATLVTLGDLRNPAAVLCLLGLVLIAALNYRRVAGATLIGILAVTAIGIPLGLATFSGIVSAPPSLSPTLLQLDFSRLHEPSFLIVIFSFLFVDVFDNAGTLIGVTHQAGLLDADGNLPRMKQALVADSFAAMFGSLIGTSTTTSYIESAAGVRRRRAHRADRAFCCAALRGSAVFRPARGDGAGLRVLGGAALRRLRDGARIGGDGLGRHYRNRPRGGRGGDHAADLFDRDRNRAGLHHLCADQTHRRPLRRRQARGAGAGADFRDQVRARLDR